MYYFSAEFPKNIVSRELYDELKMFNINVTDLIAATYAYGDISYNDLFTVIMICLKFDVVSFELSSKKPL